MSCTSSLPLRSTGGSAAEPQARVLLADEEMPPVNYTTVIAGACMSVEGQLQRLVSP